MMSEPISSCHWVRAIIHFAKINERDFDERTGAIYFPCRKRYDTQNGTLPISLSRNTRGENKAELLVFMDASAYVKLDIRKYVILSENLRTEVKQNRRASWVMYLRMSETCKKKKNIQIYYYIYSYFNYLIYNIYVVTLYLMYLLYYGNYLLGI